MKHNLGKTKKALVALALSATCVLSGVPMLRYSHQNVQAAYSYYQSPTTTIIKNGDFKTKTSKGDNSPASIDGNNWTVKVSENVVCGVIDTSSSNQYGLTTVPKPSTSISDRDNYVLMFRGATETAVTTDKEYVESDSATLEADKFYEISVYAMTQGSGAGTISSSELGMSLSVTATEWCKYTLYVQTDSFQSKSFTLRLSFNKGNNFGAVFYDHIIVSEISEADYLGADESINTVKKNSFQRNSLTSFKNSNFENSLEEYWTVEGGNGVSKIYADTKQNINTQINKIFGTTGSPANAFDGDTTNSLFFINEDSVTESKTISSVTNDTDSTKDNSLTIPQHGLYRLSFILKTGGDTSGLKATLKPANEEISALEQSSLKSSSSSDARNGFTVVSFYIKGSCEQDEKVSLKMSLGTEKGWAIVDNIVFEAITTSELSSKTSTSNTLDLSTMTDTSDIKNGQFNFATIDSLSDNYIITDGSVSLKYPLSPTNWTISKSSSETFSSGIVRIGQFISGSSIKNPGANSAYYEDFASLNSGEYSEDKENVLMVRSSTKEDVSYTSSAVTVSTNSKSSQTKVTFTVGVNTNGTSNAFVKFVDSNDKTLAIFDNINTQDQWKQLYFYLTNGISSTNVKMIVGVHGSSNGQQCAFFDCARYLSSEKVVEGSTSLSVNLYENNFSTAKMNNGQRTQEALGFNTTKLSNVNECSTNIYTKLDSPNLPTRPSSTSALALQNYYENSYQTIATNYTYSLKNKSYYKFCAWIKTEDLSSAGFGRMEVVTLDSDGNIIEDEENTNIFKKIVTPETGDDEENGYKLYTIYVLAEADQNVKLLFSLGTSDNPTAGKMYIDSFTVTDVESSEYIGKTSDDYTIVSKVVEQPEEDDTETDDTTNQTTASEVNIWILSSSILLVIALGFAIAGYLLRRIPKKQKHEKVKKSEYKKSPKAINEKQIKAELKSKREISLENLNSRLASLQEEYDSIKAEYDSKSTGDETTDGKLYSEYTKELNKVNDKIEYLQSAVTYLQSNQNIRSSERSEIKSKKKQVEKEFNALKNPKKQKTEDKPKSKKKK